MRSQLYAATGLLKSVWTAKFPLSNFHTIVNNDQYHAFRSARPSKDGMRTAILEKGVRTIISLEDKNEGPKVAAAIAQEQQWVAELNEELKDQLGGEKVEWFNYPMRASQDQNWDYDEDIEGKVKEAATQVPGQTRGVLFHCFEGRDRTGTIAAEFEINTLHVDPNDAFITMMRDGFHRQPALVQFLKLKYHYRGNAFADA
jgi:protein-tyrosine phosphatase